MKKTNNTTAPAQLKYSREYVAHRLCQLQCLKADHFDTADQRIHDRIRGRIEELESIRRILES